MTTNEVKEILTMPKEERKPLLQIPDKNLLKTGYAVLDVHLSGTTRGGYGKGLFIVISGDSSTGKTWLSNTCLAEAVQNKHFDDYDLIFDNVENGNLMDLIYFFGQGVSDRWQPPRGTQKSPIYSATCQDLYSGLTKRLKNPKKFIYIVDSETSLFAEQSEARHEENIKLRDKGKKTKASYGMEKAKENSDKLRMIVPKLEKHGSILIMITQVRKKIEMGYGDDRTRDGGLSLGFYAHIELWTKKLAKIKTEIRGKDRQIGQNVEIDIRKNRINGWLGKISMPFYFNYGVDEIGGCIDYLVDERHWKKKNGLIYAEELELSLKKDALIEQIQEDGSEGVVRKAVQRCFLAIEAAKRKAVHRKPRYT